MKRIFELKQKYTTKKLNGKSLLMEDESYSRRKSIYIDIKKHVAKVNGIIKLNTEGKLK